MDRRKSPVAIDHKGSQLQRVDYNCDWRFLFPAKDTDSYEHLVVLGGPEELEQEMLDSGFVQRVSRTIIDEPGADALVYRHDAPDTLPAAVQTLLPEGIAYIEYERKPLQLLRGNRSDVAETLRSSGLRQIGRYLIRPDASDVQVYIPLDRPDPLRWYLRTLFPMTSPAKHALSLLSGHFPELIAAFPQFARHCAIIAVASGSSPNMSPVERNLAFPHLEIDESLSPLVLRNTDGGANRTILFLFRPEHTRPSAVLKVVGSAEENSRNEHEQRALREIRELLSPQFRQSVPTPWGLHQWQGVAIAAESCMPGQSLLMMTRHWRAGLPDHIRALELATTWLAEFHCQTTLSRAEWDDRAVHYWVQSRLEAYASAVGKSATEKTLFELTTARAETLIGVPMPRVWTHGDFKERNVFCDGDTVGVIDWEVSTPGLPLLDMLYFSTLWFHAAESLRVKTTKLQSFARLHRHSESGSLAIQAVRRTTKHYLDRLQVDHRFYPVLLVLLWVERALKRHSKQIVSDDLDSNPREANPYIGYVGVLAEDAERLFSGHPES